MKTSGKFFYWTPRILSICFIVFISLFALDVFSEYSGFEAIFPFFIHLVPSLLLLIIMMIAWKHEWVGAIIFLGFALFYVWDVGFTRPFSWYVAIALPASLVGILYLVSWMQKRVRNSIKQLDRE